MSNGGGRRGRTGRSGGDDGGGLLLPFAVFPSAPPESGNELDHRHTSVTHPRKIHQRYMS